MLEDEISRISVTTLKADSVIVINVDRFLSAEQRDHVHTMVTKAGIDNNVLILEGGITMDVVERA
jgi:hypothetical protein